MNVRFLFVLSCCASLLLAACGDESKDSPADSPGDDGQASTPEPGTPPAPSTNAPPSGQPIPLIAWVDDLVDRHTDELSLPDTVHDKNIADNEDPATFDKRFQNQ